MSVPARRRLALAVRRSPYDGEIVRLAWPALGALAADPLVSLVDLAYVGRLGTTELAAVAVAAAVFGVAFAAFNFLSYGTTTLVAVAMARGDAPAAGRVATTSILAGLALGAIAMVLLITFPFPLLKALGAGDELLDPATTYLRIRALALPALLFITALHGVFRGLQNTRTPFLVAGGLSLVNLVLDPILIFGLGMGLAGAAWATVAAQVSGAVAFALALRLVVRSGQMPLARPGMAEAIAMGSAGRSLILRTMSLLAFFTGTTAVAARLGTVPVAAHQVAAQVFLFLSLVLDAVAITAQAMVGRAVGEADRVALVAQVDRLLALGTGAGAAIAATLVLAAPLIPLVFTDDQAVVDAIRGVLPQLALVQLIGGAVFAWDGIVIGATDFTYAMKATVIPSVIAGAALLAAYRLGTTLNGVWWVVVALMVLRAGMLARWHGRLV